MNNRVERYKQIGDVLSRHGLGFFASVAGLGRWIPFHHGVLGHERRSEPYTTPEHLRLALEELGPTFIKLGQILSTRSDLLPPDFLSELTKLQDAAPPVAASTIRTLIDQELGAAPEELFTEFDAEPLASASIGQAHAATLHDGTAVVVKVRRPDVIPTIEQDLEILQNLAMEASRRWEAAADYNLTGLASEFARTLRSELDYLQEGRNAERFALNFASNPNVHIPEVFWPVTTSRVLTLERIIGIKVDDVAALDSAGINREELASRAAELAYAMIFEDGFFHADPHPGNLFIEAGGRIGLIDFGMVGEVDERLREQLGALLRALTGDDASRVAEALLELSVMKRSVDRSRLNADLTEFMSLYRGRRIGEINIGPLVSRMLALLRAHHLQLPREVPMLSKFILMVEGIGVQLDPDFNLGEFLQPYAQQLTLSYFSPEALAKRLARSGLDAAQLALDLPERLRRLLDLVDSSGVEVHLRADELDPFMERVERVGNRLVAGIIAAAFIKGIGELASSDKNLWGRWERPLMGIGLGAASALGTYLAWTARRNKRSRR
ncbi:MAG TPA: AarF/ABC1/UbiB kinase family protein [Propionibacteriaceae bacterium]